MILTPFVCGGKWFKVLSNSHKTLYQVPWFNTHHIFVTEPSLRCKILLPDYQEGFRLQYAVLLFKKTNEISFRKSYSTKVSLKISILTMWQNHLKLYVTVHNPVFLNILVYRNKIKLAPSINQRLSFSKNNKKWRVM